MLHLCDRYVIVEDYFGLYEDKIAICCCDSLLQCKEIIDLYLKKNKGRPIVYQVKKIADDYIDYMDDPYYKNPLTGEKYDFTNYLDGIKA